ncbi:MAG: UDP-N-acetylmuramoyl-tripeptide--D-alanyl-D-alanine ligase [Alphaproteobacteria bacterium]|nr:UDP-N-acetylmuramoyl-tripeptide--D-alanyl-D-alanine ligase [Alphaproteobacteria bacterium]MCH9833332.1 UDP-N-acetylmuramoyl-tripeptide--D-alanyl-D-alanine ligase [Alphaproteobacteria bacterium]
MTIWTAKDLVKATGGSTTTDWIATGISIDSRTLSPGDLFVALNAERDGHDYVAEAFAAGAVAALVTHVPNGVSADEPLLIVPDVLTGLESIGIAARARTAATIVAITGSVGKTSTKEMLRTILSEQGRTHASVASYNNHWGVPLTLARMPADTEYAVIEIGMNNPGEIAPLAKMVRPHVALITMVAAAHLAAFDNICGIAWEKASILDGLEEKGTGVFNNDCSTALILLSKVHDLKCRSVSFGLTGSDFKLKSWDLGQGNTVVEAEVRGAPLLFKIDAVGKHFAMNGLGALAATEVLGADLALAVQSLGRWAPDDGRGAREVIHLDPVETQMVIELIDDSYNANPTSMEAALDVLAIGRIINNTGTIAEGRRIAFLGDMKELGSQAVSMHGDLACLDVMETIDKIYCIGPLMRHLYEALPLEKRGLWTETSAEMVTNIRRKLKSGDVVLVKGSLSMKLALVVDAIRKMSHPVSAGTKLQDKV